MKRIFNTLFAGVLILSGWACTEVEQLAIDPAATTAPVLLSSEIGENTVVATFTPGSFDVNAPVYNTMALVRVNDKDVNRVLGTTEKDNTLTLRFSEINKNLIAAGCDYGETVSFQLAIRTSLQKATADNGLNGYVDSEGRITVESYEIPVPTSGDDPYAAYKEKSVWSVIGSIASTGNSWGQDEDMYTDGTWHVAKSIVLTASDQFKFRRDAGWDTNFGAEGDVEPFIVELDKEYTAVAGGKNLAVPVDGKYDLILDPEAKTYKIINAKEAAEPEFLPDINVDDYTEMPGMAGAETWGIIGPAVSDWSVDVDLEKISDNPEIWRAKAVPFDAGSFKFRGNDTWGDYDLGGGTFGLETPIVMTKGGSDMTAEAGTYDVWLYPTAGVAYLKASTGTITPPANELPTEMYMIGAAFGNWNWESDEVVDLIPVNGKKGQFWTIRYIEADSPFKFAPGKAWSGDFTGLGEDSGYTVSGTNCVVAENGVYMIYVDTDNKKLCIEPAQVYGIGLCFGENNDVAWGEGMEKALFKAEGNKLVGTTLYTGEVRLYAASSIATSEWWTREFVFFDGKIAYRGNGGDQDRVSIEAGKKITLDFNAGTATVE